MASSVPQSTKVHVSPKAPKNPPTAAEIELKAGSGKTKIVVLPLIHLLNVPKKVDEADRNLDSNYYFTIVN